MADEQPNFESDEIPATTTTVSSEPDSTEGGDRSESPGCPDCEARKAALSSRWGIASAIRDRYHRLRDDRSLHRVLHAERPHQLGALFVDFENIYLAFRDLVAKPLEMTIHVLTRLRDNLQHEQAVSMVMGRAYASWEYGAARDALSHLSLLGIVPQYVLSRPQKSSADLKLSIDLMEVLLTRSDITSFVIAGGDRDYMPIVEKIKERAKNIIIVSPGQATSGDLIALVGEECFIDATEMLPGDAQPPSSHFTRSMPIPVEESGVTLPHAATVDPDDKKKEGSQEGGTGAAATSADEGEEKEDEEQGGEAPKEASGPAAEPTAPEPAQSEAGEEGDAERDYAVTRGGRNEKAEEEGYPPATVQVEPEDEVTADRTLRRFMHEFAIQDLWSCVGLILRAQAEIRNREIWVGPFLKNYMNEEFDFMNNAQRKRLLGIMEEVGAIEVNEKLDRMGEQTYSVLTVDWSSPIIKTGLVRSQR
jgi:hypothetical protein